MTDLLHWSHQVNRRQVLRGAGMGTAGLAGAALLGCSSGPKPAAPGASTGGAPAAAKPMTPKTGGRFSEVLDGSPVDFNPFTNTSNIASHVTNPCTNQLVQMDPDDMWEKSSGIKPDLAKSWEITPDGLTYTFKLIQNAKFHDGTPFTAADVIATLDRNKNPPKGVSSPRSTQLKPVKSVEAPDPYTVVIKLTRPAAVMLPVLAQGWMVMQSEKDIKGTFDYKNKINGTGPFRLREYRLGTQAILDRNKDYHIKDRPYLDGHDMNYIPDPATQLAQTLAGNILFNDRVFPTDQDAVKKSQGDKFTYPRTPVMSVTTLRIQTKKAPWSDIRVRQALSMVLDRQEALNVLSSGVGYIGGLMIPGGSYAYSQEEFEKLPNYQPYTTASLAEAKKLMAAAGVPAARSMKMLSGSQTDLARNTTYTASQITKLGWTVTAEVVDDATLRTRQNAGDFELSSGNVAGAIDDPDTWWPDNYLKDSPSNFSKMESQEIEDLFNKQSIEQDPQKRIAITKELQKATMLQYGTIPIYWRNRIAVVSKIVKDYTLHVNNYNNNRYEHVWLDK